MAINIYHSHSDVAEITYYGVMKGSGLVETLSGTMDELAEHMCDVMVKHNFVLADACSVDTGEILLIVTRS